MSERECFYKNIIPILKPDQYFFPPKRYSFLIRRDSQNHKPDQQFPALKKCQFIRGNISSDTPTSFFCLSRNPSKEINIFPASPPAHFFLPSRSIPDQVFLGLPPSHLGHLLAGGVLQLLGLVVVWGDFEQPVVLDLNHVPHVLLRCEHQLVVDHPSAKKKAGCD